MDVNHLVKCHSAVPVADHGNMPELDFTVELDVAP